MKRMLLLLSLVGLWASLTVAQNSPAAGQSATPDSNNQANTNSVQGCLSVMDGNYMLTQDGNSATYKLMGKETQLKKHVGHEVAITGEVTGSAGASGQEQGQGDTSARPSAPPAIQVTDVKMVAKSCTTGASAPPSH